MNYLLNLYNKDKLKNPQVNLGAKYTDGFVYHMPCHLYAVGDGTASIKLLQELCSVKVTDLKAGCCGLAGTFGMQKKNYELSSQIAESLRAALKKSPTKNVLTECAACKMQIEHISDCVVSHPIKLIAGAYEVLK